MKANLFAALLALCVVCLPTQAATHPNKKSIASQNFPKIDLNSASANQLASTLSGIGPKRAEAIVQHRHEHGNFKAIEELAQVKGLGNQFLKNHIKELREVLIIK